MFMNRFHVELKLAEIKAKKFSWEETIPWGRRHHARVPPSVTSKQATERIERNLDKSIASSECIR